MLDGSRRNFADQMPGVSGDLTLAELQEMASRQQQQMEAQQQVLVAKEQRVKYLRQQEARHAQLATEGERVRRMRERVESQELKLRKLRALRGQAEQHRASNTSLTGELDAVRAVFNEKEKELAMAVARVDRLTRQLQELRSNSSGNNQADSKQAAAATELEKLRKELMLRNKLNEQQSNTISAKEKMLNQRREQVARMDARITELQHRLRKRQAQEIQVKQQQLRQAQDQGKGPPVANRSGHRNDPGGSSSARNVATVEPYIQYAPQNVAKDDMYSKSTGGGNFLKQDPKYQTLPARVKFVPPNGDSGGGGGGGVGKVTKPVEMNNNSELIEEYQLPTVLPGKAGTNHSQLGGKNQELPAATGHRPGQPPAHLNVPGSVPDPTALPKPGSRPASANQSSVVFPDNLKAHPAFMGAGDGPGYSSKSAGPAPLGAFINISEEERQAGSGQSSPASSEASTSSGGIQVKGTPTEVNTAPIGPVSAMIERLNRTGLVQQQPPTSAPQGQDRSVFTQRAGQPSQESRHFDKLPGTASSSSTPAEGLPNYNGNSRNQPLPASSPPFDETDRASQASVLKHHPQTSSGSTGPHLNQKPAPTYRYASKSQIANTYMGRLGSAVMDRYQRNLNQIYQSLDASATPGQNSSDAAQPAGEARTSFTTQPGSTGPEQTGPAGQAHPQFGVVSSPSYPDIASDKGSFKLNTPKQVRRRHSDSENEEMNKALQERQDLEQRDRQKQQQQKQSSSDKTDATATPASTQAKSEATASSNQKQKPNVKSASSSSSSSSSYPDTSKENQSTSTAAQPDSKSDVSSSSDKPDNTSAVLSSGSKAHPTDPTPQAPGEVDKENKADGGTVAKVLRRSKSNLKQEGSGRRSSNRVSFDPLALLLDASLEGELDLVKKVALQVDDVSTPNDEGITALHNAICAGHYEIVKVLVEFGCDVNSPDSDGWTPLHCAASCNNLAMVRFLVEHGACVFAATISDQETAADKCEEEEDGYDGCSDYLYSIQEKLGITNSGEVYAVFDYQATKTDELSFQIGDKLTVLRKGDDSEKEWWWTRFNGKEGYIPRNLLGLHPRVIPAPKEISNC